MTGVGSANELDLVGETSRTAGRARKGSLDYLDALRGIAALFVAVFAHYIVFTNMYQPSGGNLTAIPFYRYLSVLYSGAFLFVDLFFVLSGLIFRHVYFDKISRGLVSPKDFFWTRFSRLYPLHILTFGLCAVLACSFSARYGHDLIYGCNDAYHALLNILFVQKGFFESCMSFNGPSWSLSVEGFLYLIFFLVSASGYGRLWAPALVAAAVATLFFRFHWEFLLNAEICRGVFGFFLGFMVYEAIAVPRLFNRTLAILLFALVAFVVSGYLLKRRGFVSCSASVAFAITVLLIGKLGPIRRFLETRSLRLLGDLSLSIYLMHIPTAMTIIFIFRYLNAPIPTSDIRFELFYVVTVLSVAMLVNRIYEMPAKELLRRLLVSPRAETREAVRSAPVVLASTETSPLSIEN
jgi:peptidoglycan/LPS O-acetylase OafA/YrhL